MALDGHNNTHFGTSDYKKKAPDGGFGWVVVGGATIMGALFTIPSTVISIAFNLLMETMSASAEQVSMMASLLCCIFNIAGPLSSSFTQSTSCRKGAIVGGIISCFALLISVWVTSIQLLTLTFGCIAGIGSSFTMNSSTYVINEYFVKRRGLATGIRMAGESIGRVVFLPILQFLMVFYGYQGLMLLASAFMLNICVCGSLFQPVKRHLVLEIPDKEQVPLQNQNDITSEATGMDNGYKENEPVSKKTQFFFWKRIYNALIGKLQLSMMKTPIFYIFFMNNFANSLTLFFANLFMYPFILDKGLQEMQVAFVLMVLAFSDIIGRLVITPLMDFPRLGVRNINIISCSASATMMWCLTLANSFTSIVTVVCFLGFFSGGQLSGFVALSAKVVGPSKVPTVMGLTQFFRGLLLLGFGPLLGKLRDLTGNFRVCYYIFAAFNYLVAIIWITEMLVKRWHKSQKLNPI